MIADDTLIEEVAKAMWNSQLDDSLPSWDDFKLPMDAALISEFKGMARAGIAAYERIKAGK